MLTFGDLGIGDKFTYLSCEGDEGYHGGSNDFRYLFMKFRITRKSEDTMESNAIKLSTGLVDYIPDGKEVIKVE